MKKTNASKRRFLGIMLAAIMVFSFAPQAVLAMEAALEPAEGDVTEVINTEDTITGAMPDEAAEETAALEAGTTATDTAVATPDVAAPEATTPDAAAETPVPAGAAEQQAALFAAAEPIAPAEPDFSQIAVSGYNGAYDGVEHGVTVTGVPDGYTVQYALSSASPSYFNTTPLTQKAVGTRKVYVRVVDVGANVVWGPEAAEITVTRLADVTVSGFSGPYDGLEHGLTVAGVPEGFAVQYSKNSYSGFTANPVTRTQIGSTPAFARVVDPANNNYVIWGPQAYDITVNMPDGFVIHDYTCGYDGAAHSVSVSVPDGFTAQYATSSAASAKQYGDPAEYHSGLTQTLAGTKTVYVRVLDKDGNIAMPAAAYKVTVTLPEGFAVQGYTGTYDGQEHGLAVTAPEGYTVEYSTETTAASFTDTPVTRAEPGTTAVYVRAKDPAGKFITDSTGTAANRYAITINKIVFNVQVADGTYLYGEPEPDLAPALTNPEILPEGYSAADIEAAVGYSYEPDNPGKANSKMRPVTFTVDESKLPPHSTVQIYNHTGAAVTAANKHYMTAQPRAMGITAGSGEYFEDGSYTLTYGDPIPDVAGNIAVTGILEEDMDDVPFKTIATAHPYVWSDTGALQFDTQSAIDINALNPENRLAIGAYSYQIHLNSHGDADANGNVGSHLKYAGVMFSLNNLYIYPKAVTVTPDDATKVYGEPDPALTGSDSGLAYEDSIGYTYYRETGELAGTYAVYADKLAYNAHKNYDFSYAAGTFEITKRDLTLNGNSDTFVYNGTDHAVGSYTADGLAEGDTVSGVLYEARRAEVGTSDGAFDLAGIVITNADGADVTACYNLFENPGQIEVTPALANPTPADPNPADPNPADPSPVVPAVQADPAAPVVPVVPVTVDPAAPAVVPAAPIADAPADLVDTATVPEEAPAQTMTIEDAAVPADSGNVEGATPEELTIEENAVPLDSGGDAHWALLNLLLTIGTGILMVVALAGYFTGKKRKDEEDEAHTHRLDRAKSERQVKRRGVIRLLTVIPMLIAVIVFLLTEDMRLPMQMTDEWTIWMAAIVVVQVLILALTKKKHEKPEDGEMNGVQPQNS